MGIIIVPASWDCYEAYTREYIVVPGTQQTLTHLNIRHQNVLTSQQLWVQMPVFSSTPSLYGPVPLFARDKGASWDPGLLS